MLEVNKLNDQGLNQLITGKAKLPGAQDFKIYGKSTKSGPIPF